MRLRKCIAVSLRRPFSFKSDCLRAVCLLLLIGLITTSAVGGAQTRRSKQAIKKGATAANQLSKLREEFIKATKEYQASLGKLLAIYERNVSKAEERLAQTKTLYSEGLISKSQLDENERAVASAKDKVDEVKKQLATAETQIGDTLLEAKAAEQKFGMARKGSLVRTASYIRYNGAAAWALSDAWKVQRFFLDAFKRPLPIGVFGQGTIHDRWRLDHRNAMDVSLNPDGPEGQALMDFLRLNGIPFSAFREAIPGTATGPHIHVGRPSHRY